MPFRKWLLIWWSCIYIDSNKDALPTQRLMPWLTLFLSFLMSPPLIKNRFFLLLLSSLNSHPCTPCLFICLLLCCHPSICQPTVHHSNYPLWILPLTHSLAPYTGFHWCSQRFDRERNPNGPLNLWRCWLWQNWSCPACHLLCSFSRETSYGSRTHYCFSQATFWCYFRPVFCLPKYQGWTSEQVSGTPSLLTYDIHLMHSGICNLQINGGPSYNWLNFRIVLVS